MNDKEIFEIIEGEERFNEHRSVVIYSTTFGSENFTDCMDCGIKLYCSNVERDCLVSIFGWIDQAILEVHMTTNLENAVKEIFEYSPDQGGDMGMISKIDDGYLIMDIGYRYKAGQNGIVSPAQR